MKHVLMVGALIGVVGLAAAPRAEQSPLPSRAIAEQAATLEGCLKRGAADGEFTFMSGRELYGVVAAASVNLNAHVDHQVQLTGTVEKGPMSAVIRASALKMVATTCAA
jgi:hypothetical protein